MDTGNTLRSDEVLVAQIAEGNPAALRTLFERFGTVVLAVTRRCCGSPADAEEVTQEVFLEVWNRARTFDPRRASARTWVMTIARSRAVDRARSIASELRRRESAADERPAPTPGPIDLLAGREEAIALASAVSRLPPTQREAIGLTYYEGLSSQEAARALSVPLGTVKTRLRLALRRLPALLATEASAPHA